MPDPEMVAPPKWYSEKTFIWPMSVGYDIFVVGRYRLTGMATVKGSWSTSSGADEFPPREVSNPNWPPSLPLTRRARDVAIDSQGVLVNSYLEGTPQLVPAVEIKPPTTSDFDFRAPVLPGTGNAYAYAWSTPTGTTTSVSVMCYAANGSAANKDMHLWYQKPDQTWVKDGFFSVINFGNAGYYSITKDLSNTLAWPDGNFRVQLRVGTLATETQLVPVRAKYEPEQGMILDNDAVGFAAGPEWLTGTAGGNAYGADHRATQLASAGPATWTFDGLTADAIYQIYVYYDGTGGIRKQVTYTLGGQPVVINQDDDQPSSLRRYVGQTAADASGQIVLSLAATAGKWTIADAAEVVPVPQEVPDVREPDILLCVGNSQIAGRPLLTELANPDDYRSLECYVYDRTVEAYSPDGLTPSRPGLRIHDNDGTRRCGPLDVVGRDWQGVLVRRCKGDPGGISAWQQTHFPLAYTDLEFFKAKHEMLSTAPTAILCWLHWYSAVETAAEYQAKQQSSCDFWLWRWPQVEIYLPHAVHAEPTGEQIPTNAAIDAIATTSPQIHAVAFNGLNLTLSDNVHLDAASAMIAGERISAAMGL